MKQEKRVLLVDDHSLVRAGIRHLINEIDGFKVIAEAANIAEAVKQMANPSPDIVVTDLDMGQDNGLDLLKTISTDYPNIKAVILSMHSSDEMVSQALQHGAAAYILKESAPEELGFALLAVSRHETFLSPSVTTKMLNQFVRPESKPSNPLDFLTNRQIEILTMLAKGNSTKEIAYKLELSDKTVAAHRLQIMERLEIRDIAGLVMFAIKNGLIEIDA